MMKKAMVMACAALLGAGAAFGGLISDDPGELAVSGQVFLPDHADCDLFKLGLGAQVSYREWFSFPWGVGVNLGVSQWQVDDASNAFKIQYVSDYDGEVLVIVGGVFVAEALSVIIQVISFKSTGKRVFRMSPIHHHFELGGWSEKRVVAVFWLAGAFCGALALIVLAIGRTGGI